MIPDAYLEEAFPLMKWFVAFSDQIEDLIKRELENAPTTFPDEVIEIVVDNVREGLEEAILEHPDDNYYAQRVSDVLDYYDETSQSTVLDNIRNSHYKTPALNTVIVERERFGKYLGEELRDNVSVDFATDQISCDVCAARWHADLDADHAESCAIGKTEKWLKAYGFDPLDAYLMEKSNAK